MALSLASSSLVAERAVAIAAVRSASRLCRSVRADLGPADTMSKADRSPVTVADLGAQALISLALAEQLPGDPLMGEEDSAPLQGSAAIADAVLGRVQGERPGSSMAEVSAALDRCDDQGGPGRRWWTLDPVDGTKGFLRDEQYAVALALVEDGEVVLGVLGCPNLPSSLDAPSDGRVGWLFVSERGGGAWRLPLQAGPADAEPLGVDLRTDKWTVRYAESVEAGHSAQAESAGVAERLGITREPLRLDSQAKYAVVARGEAAIYLRLPHGSYRENVWDHAAGSILVSEAGGVVTDALGQPLDFTAGRRLERNRGIVATSPLLHGSIVEAVAAARSRPTLSVDEASDQGGLPGPTE